MLVIAVNMYKLEKLKKYKYLILYQILYCNFFLRKQVLLVKKKKLDFFKSK